LSDGKKDEMYLDANEIMRRKRKTTRKNKKRATRMKAKMMKGTLL
jgi:hypothetical protein